MKIDILLTVVAFLLVFSPPVHGLFASNSLQEYIESFIDAAKFEFEGTINLNESAIGQIWFYFKSNYGRVYSSVGSYSGLITGCISLFTPRGREATSPCLS